MRSLSKRFPGLSRTELICTLCEHLDWLTPVGRPKFEACAKLLGRLEAAEELHLPLLQENKRHPGPGPAQRNARTRAAIHGYRWRTPCRSSIGSACAW